MAHPRGHNASHVSPCDAAERSDAAVLASFRGFAWRLDGGVVRTIGRGEMPCFEALRCSARELLNATFAWSRSARPQVGPSH